MDFTRVTNFLESLSGVGIPGADLGIYQKGKEVYRHQSGFANLENLAPIEPDSLYPFYSMTKVITCVAALRFYEEGRFQLNDPLGEYLPEFKHMKVKTERGNGMAAEEPSAQPIRVVDLFTMSSGLTYDPSENLIKASKKAKGNYTLKEFATALAKDPLCFEPGTHWRYSFSHDVLGYFIEVLAGKSLGQYFYENIFAPLGMKDTFFRVPVEKQNRLVTCYSYDDKTQSHKRYDAEVYNYRDPDFKMESGGGGLISSVDDYAIFANTLCAGGTADNGYRLIGNATIELMRTNHLDDVRMRDYNWPHHGGYGYGLGVRTMVDKAAGGSNSSIGEYGWSGMAGTYVLIDPAYDLTYVYAQQLIDSKEDYVAPRLRNIVYACL